MLNNVALVGWILAGLVVFFYAGIVIGVYEAVRKRRGKSRTEGASPDEDLTPREERTRSTRSAIIRFIIGVLVLCAGWTWYVLSADSLTATERTHLALLAVFASFSLLPHLVVGPISRRIPGWFRPLVVVHLLLANVPLGITGVIENPWTGVTLPELKAPGAEFLSYLAASALIVIGLMIVIRFWAKNQVNNDLELQAEIRALEAEQAASDQALPPLERQRVVAERAAEERRGWWRLRIMFVGMTILATIAIYVASLSSASPAP